MSFAGRWMELVITMLSKISQTQKGKYPHVFCHMRNAELKKNKGHELEGTTCRAEPLGGGRGKREDMCGENLVEIVCMHV
jgi:hypothetical protein